MPIRGWSEHYISQDASLFCYSIQEETKAIDFIKLSGLALLENEKSNLTSRLATTRLDPAPRDLKR